jgi:4-hydroxy-3-methylbut-2-en-1-yl diphosphate reductase
MKLYLANPRGFCAGVDRAIAIVERALELFGTPIYVRHEVVHNRYVVHRLGGLGAIFVEELDEIPDGSTVIFSAHGVARSVYEEAERRSLRVFDATCPLVTKVHMEVRRNADMGREVILVGHRGHPEVEGTLGQHVGGSGRIYLVEDTKDVAGLAVCDPSRLAYVTQTTLSVDDTVQIVNALRRRFPDIQGPRKDDICYATQNRQNAVKELITTCDLVLVVGSTTSSNSNRLKELAQKGGVEAYLIDGPQDIDNTWLSGKENVGITAGASAPEILVDQVISRLQAIGATLISHDVGQVENVNFGLPKSLL